MPYSRDLDLRVAEAMGVVSGAARETETTRQRYSEAAARLEDGRKELLMPPECRWGTVGPDGTFAGCRYPRGNPSLQAIKRAHSD